MKISLLSICRSKTLLDYQSVLENNVQAKSTDIGLLESEIGFIKSEKAQVQSEMNAVNQVIDGVVYGVKSWIINYGLNLGNYLMFSLFSRSAFDCFNINKYKITKQN